MHLKSLELVGFKSFGKRTKLSFESPITAVVGPNGSGKSNIAEGFRFVLGEQSMKSMRGKRGEDLIFGGSKSVPRGNRGSVKVVFDNRKRILGIDYDEVTIERVVFRDGTNEYLINGSRVRLRDVLELLAGGNIGSSGHHIISQGEADRILNASLKERRQTIEDALGLKIFQYKKHESVKKLEKTEENMRQVESVRREIAPHLRFLKRQVEKIEKAREMRGELLELYREYFKREELFLESAKSSLSAAKRAPERELQEIEARLGEIRAQITETAREKQLQESLAQNKRALQKIREEKSALMRDVGRLEGTVSALGAHKKNEGARGAGAEIAVPFSEIERLADDIERKLDGLHGESTREDLFATLENIRSLLRSYLRSKREGGEGATEERGGANELEKFERERAQLEEHIKTFNEQETAHEEEHAAVASALEKERTSNREAERAEFELRARREELRGVLARIASDGENLIRIENDFKRELGEAGVLIGREAAHYRSVNIVGVNEQSVATESREKQEERRRKIERVKIRIEEVGGGAGDDVVREYNGTLERDAFFAHELEDLRTSKESLEVLIKELEEKLDTQFKEGIKKINTLFQEFFALMFGGGRASLEVVKEERRRRSTLTTPDQELEDEDMAPEETFEGIGISVLLPHKRIRGLEVLSGGERALTSIALIFAISQVNPPPFLILDETDAALDEANSRKYGDMIVNLAQHSQLILITHNRETMSRAGVLYGVTMGSDSVSQILSVKFDEAVAVAK